MGDAVVPGRAAFSGKSVFIGKDWPGGAQETSFEAVDFLRSASAQAIALLASTGWKTAGLLGADQTGALAALRDYAEQRWERGSSGDIISMIDGAAAMAWLVEHRPAMADMLRDRDRLVAFIASDAAEPDLLPAPALALAL